MERRSIRASYKQGFGHSSQRYSKNNYQIQGRKYVDNVKGTEFYIRPDDLIWEQNSKTDRNTRLFIELDGDNVNYQAGQ